MRFQNVDCYILDDGGFLVMTNQDDDIDQVGLFILLSLTKLKVNCVITVMSLVRLKF